MNFLLPKVPKLSLPKFAFNRRRISVRNTLVGICIMVVILVVGVAALELLVRKIKPQISYTEALDLSMGIWQTDPYVPFRFKPNIHLEGLDINSLGYKGPEFSITKPVGGYRILALGDSFVEGIDHDYRTAWPWMIQQNFQNLGIGNFEVVNAGFRDGFSPDAYYAYLVGDGLALQPDMVILGVYLQNDLSDIRDNRWVRVDEQGLPLKVVSSWKLIDAAGRQKDGVIPLRYRYPILNESHLWVLLSNWIEKQFPSLVHTPEETKRLAQLEYAVQVTFSSCPIIPNCISQMAPEMEKLNKVLSGTAQLLASRHIQFLIVFQPSVWQLGIVNNKSDVTNEGIYNLQNQVMEYFRSHNLTAQFLDLTEPFSQKADPRQYYYPNPETHWNPEGNKFTADLITAKIRSMIGQ
jgi:hypothetical protein